MLEVLPAEGPADPELCEPALFAAAELSSGLDCGTDGAGGAALLVSGAELLSIRAPKTSFLWLGSGRADLGGAL